MLSSYQLRRIIKWSALPVLIYLVLTNNVLVTIFLNFCLAGVIPGRAEPISPYLSMISIAILGLLMVLLSLHRYRIASYTEGRRQSTRTRTERSADLAGIYDRSMVRSSAPFVSSFSISLRISLMKFRSTIGETCHTGRRRMETVWWAVKQRLRIVAVSFATMLAQLLGLLIVVGLYVGRQFGILWTRAEPYLRQLDGWLEKQVTVARKTVRRSIESNEIADTVLTALAEPFKYVHSKLTPRKLQVAEQTTDTIDAASAGPLSDYQPSN